MKHSTSIRGILKAVVLPVYVLILLNIAFLEHVCYAAMAIIKEPIAEMNTHLPLQIGLPASPLSAAPEHTALCQRAHHALCGEYVTILRPEDFMHDKQEEVQVAVHRVAYGEDEHGNFLNSFWVNKQHIALVSELADNEELLAAMPCPEYAQKPTIVLTYPWHQFSVGTRFTHMPEKDTDKEYAIAHINYDNKEALVDYIPKVDALVEEVQDVHASRQLLIRIARALIDRVAASGERQVIPYVWGGSSFVHSHRDDDFEQLEGVWERERLHELYTGYDCSQFVRRVAQMAGISFPWKTTGIMEKKLRAFNEHDQCQEGDLLWIQGHIMILGKDELFEARSYGSGYGCVHYAALKDSIDGVATSDELLQRYHAGESIYLKDKQGNVVPKEYKFKLLKIVE